MALRCVEGVAGGVPAYQPPGPFRGHEDLPMDTEKARLIRPGQALPELTPLGSVTL
jgi:hypothetical protein